MIKVYKSHMQYTYYGQTEIQFTPPNDEQERTSQNSTNDPKSNK